jgi:hypothetical protein
MVSVWRLGHVSIHRRRRLLLSFQVALLMIAGLTLFRRNRAALRRFLPVSLSPLL